MFSEKFCQVCIIGVAECWSWDWLDTGPAPGGPPLPGCHPLAPPASGNGRGQPGWCSWPHHTDTSQTKPFEWMNTFNLQQRSKTKDWNESRSRSIMHNVQIDLIIYSVLPNCTVDAPVAEAGTADGGRTGSGLLSWDHVTPAPPPPDLMITW